MHSLLREGIRRTCLRASTDLTVPPLFEILQKSKVDYSEEEVCKALPLIFKEVMTADEQLLPKEKWPARMNCSRAECFERAVKL